MDKRLKPPAAIFPLAEIQAVWSFKGGNSHPALQIFNFPGQNLPETEYQYMVHILLEFGNPVYYVYSLYPCHSYWLIAGKNWLETNGHTVFRTQTNQELTGKLCVHLYKRPEVHVHPFMQHSLSQRFGLEKILQLFFHFLWIYKETNVSVQ